MMKSKLLCYVSVKQANNFEHPSEVGWITDNKLILTLDNTYYLINLSLSNLSITKNNIYFGKQQLNSCLYVSIVSIVQSLEEAMKD